MSYPTTLPDICEGIIPQPCFSYINCTTTGFKANWTEFCCQPIQVKETKVVMLSILGIVGTIGIIFNGMTIITFLYMYCFPQRIKVKFNQEFTITQDFIHCIFGLPTFWTVYNNGYFPYSIKAWKYSALFTNSIADADFITLAWISVYFTWRRGHGRPKNQKIGNWAVLGVLVSIWICAFSIQSISLLEVFGQYGYDALDGMCPKSTNISLPTGAP